MSHVLAIPFGDNTVYLVETGDARVLIDTGPDFRGAAEVLGRALAGRLPDVVVATHGHVDHAGLGAWWQARGVPVALHRADWPLATGAAPSDAEFDALKQFALESGAPPEVTAEAIEAIEQRRRWAGASRAAGDYRPASRDRRWPSGLRYLPFAPRLDVTDVGVSGLELVHLPGHTPGNVVAWVPTEGWLFSGDQLLPGITPTPALQGHHLPGSGDWRFRSLPHFLASLRQLRALAPARCFPGHGEPFGEIVTVIDVNLAQAEQRVERTLAILREGGPSTLYAVAEGLYPRAVRRRFWQIVATAQGLLDELEARGEAVFAEGRWAATQATSAARS